VRLFAHLWRQGGWLHTKRKVVNALSNVLLRLFLRLKPRGMALRLSRPAVRLARPARSCAAFRCCAAAPDTALRVLVSHDGRLVCPNLPPGRYTVASWRAGLATREGNAVASAANCSVDASRDCGVFCTLTDAGDLVRCAALRCAALLCAAPRFPSVLTWRLGVRGAERG
jgi:hypothetical protein